jgi:hypothetical protein
MKHEQIKNVFRQMDDSDIIQVWNEYCQDACRYDDEIMDASMMEEIITNSGDTMNWLNRFFFGSDEEREGTSANPNRSYFTFNGYGNIISFDYIYNQFSDEFYYIWIDELIDYIIENENAFGVDEIEDILEESNEE